MKANEAPEKLYFGEFDKTGLEAYSNRESDNEVEYTRTDAFIEKALAYLNEKFYFNNDFYGVVSTNFNAMEELFEDFKKIYERRVSYENRKF